LLDGLGKSSGIGYQNAKAALFTRAAREIVTLVTAFGGRSETAMGLAGIGDQLVTSLGGRNRLYGELVGTGDPPEDTLRELEAGGLTVEGVESTRHVRRLAAGAAGAAPSPGDSRGRLDGGARPAVACRQQPSVLGCELGQLVGCVGSGSLGVPKTVLCIYPDALSNTGRLGEVGALAQF
jgi:hypothetical protein